MARPPNYWPELRARTVRMVVELTWDYPSQYVGITAWPRSWAPARTETLRE